MPAPIVQCSVLAVAKGGKDIRKLVWLLIIVVGTCAGAHSYGQVRLKAIVCVYVV